MADAIVADSAAQVAEFVTVPGGKHSEVGMTLAEPVPRALGWLDQFGLWGNLGVSLLGFTGAFYVLYPLGGPPGLSLAAALTAVIGGTLLGTLPVALVAVQGARTGAPAMVLLRGLFGGRASYVPTLINVVQCVGWSVFELVTISQAAKALVDHYAKGAVPGWVFVLIGGVLTGLLTVHPLGAIRVLRRYAMVAVLLVMAYLVVQLLRHPLPSFTHGTWTGFWVATDTVVGVSVSWVPLAADYTRHSRSSRSAFGGALLGYGSTQVICYVIGLIALVTVDRSGDKSAMWNAFIVLPVGWLAFGILAARELDQAFADVYSTAVSVQNLRPMWDRRVLAAVIAALATAGGLWLSISDYENFLTLLGAVFVPMSAVLVTDFFVLARGKWDLSGSAPTRWSMLVPWLLGFVMYQMINPGYQLGFWTAMWPRFDSAIGFTVQSWMSASILSFAVAGFATLALGALARWLSARREPVAELVLAPAAGTASAPEPAGDPELAGGPVSPRTERREEAGD